MGRANSDGLKAGVLVGMIALVVLFVGQTLSFTVRWLSGALSGGILILLAFGIGYATYEIYNGWTAAEDGAESELDRPQQESESNLEGSIDQTRGNDSVSDQEIDEELEELVEDTRATKKTPAREVE